MKTKKRFFSEKLDLNFSIQTPRPGAHHLGSCAKAYYVTMCVALTGNEFLGSVPLSQR